MGRPTLMQRAFRRRADRKAWGMFVVAAVGFTALWIGSGWIEQQRAPQFSTPVGYNLQVDDPRICAAVASYTLATGDHWDQRAVIARASLNRFQQLGHVPDCGQALAGILGEGLDRYLWQASLDAADAVLSGSYAIPLACARADHVVRSPARPVVNLVGLPPSVGSVARAQCVIGDLAFVEAAQ